MSKLLLFEALGMTKEKAISELESVIASDEDIDFFTVDEKIAMEYAISTLKGEWEWIPVAERSPEERHTYEVTLQGIGELEGIDNEVAYATWLGNKNNRKDNWLYHDVNNWKDKEVIAWKPRSKPYKAESEE